MEINRISVPFAHSSPPAATDKKTTVKGYASVFNTLIDAYVPTRILPGAFTKTLKEQARRIKLLWQHDQTQPIGIPTVLREEEQGLYMEAQLASTSLARDVAQLARDGVITEMSIGFDPIKATMVDEPGLGPVRHLSEVRLWEVSLVTFAANPDAQITQVHRRAFSSGDVDRQLAELDGLVAADREAQLRDLRLDAALLGVDVD